LFMPLRLALTGNLSGPDVGLQLKVVFEAGGAMANVVPLADRMEQLREWAAHPSNQKASNQKATSPPTTEASHEASLEASQEAIDEASHAAAVRAVVEALPAASAVRSQCLAALSVVDESIASAAKEVGQNNRNLRVQKLCHPVSSLCTLS
jgi:hypothetical protein